MTQATSIPALLHRLADIARGNVADRGERWAAALEADAAASVLEDVLSCADEAVQAMQELVDGQQGHADQQLINPLLVERLRTLLRSAHDISG